MYTLRVISAIGAARSGLDLEALRLAVSAHNVANVSTPVFQPSRVVAVETVGGGVRGQVETPARENGASGSEPLSGTDLAEETVTQISALGAYRANMAVLRASDQALGSLLDLLA